MSMEVIRLPLSASIRGMLISAGYTTLSSLSSISPSSLALELKISEDEAAQILKSASTGSSSSSLASTSGNSAYLDEQFVLGAQTAWDMLQTENSSAHITTTCPELDNILNGGIKCKEVTEIGGVPGIGKTQLGFSLIFIKPHRPIMIQLSINVQIPVEFGGLGGKAIYIDTEGSFMVERAMQIAEACIEDLLEYSSVHRKGFPAYQFVKQPKDFLENIFYFRVCSYTEQIAVVDYLEKFISEHKDVKIVIIDSISFHFRQDFEDMGRRTKLLTAMALKLMRVANTFRLAVVVLNQVTTKYSEGSFHLSLALGDTWSHSCTNRVILYWNGNERYAYIDKSPYIKPVSSPYSVTAKGIRNIDSNCKRIKMM